MPTFASAVQALTSIPRGMALGLPFSPDSTVSNKNITGWTLAFVVRPVGADLDDPATYSKTTGNGGITITDAVNGLFKAVLSKAETLALPVGTYDWEVWRTDNGSETRLAFGKFEVVRSVQFPA